MKKTHLLLISFVILALVISFTAVTAAPPSSGSVYKYRYGTGIFSIPKCSDGTFWNINVRAINVGNENHTLNVTIFKVNPTLDTHNSPQVTLEPFTELDHFWMDRWSAQDCGEYVIRAFTDSQDVIFTADVSGYEFDGSLIQWKPNDFATFEYSHGEWVRI